MKSLKIGGKGLVGILFSQTYPYYAYNPDLWYKIPKTVLCILLYIDNYQKGFNGEGSPYKSQKYSTKNTLKT